VKKSHVYEGVRYEVSFDVLHTPGTPNLISISKLDEKGFSISF
jgi:hypothetical protein